MADDVLTCIRCQEQPTFAGELFTNRETIEMYVCESCGGVEFFVPNRGK